MITDRMTAKVLGYLVLAMTFVIDSSCWIFAPPEARANPRFSLVVIATSLPMFLVGWLLLRKASTMREDG
ncbi:MAG: hypothetical protein JWP97_588 [Labilithrix sp.]|nr:hypothetical protein [Labilithrix sp.]